MALISPAQRIADANILFKLGLIDENDFLKLLALPTEEQLAEELIKKEREAFNHFLETGEVKND